MAKIIIALLCAAIAIKLALIALTALAALFLAAGIFSLMASADEPFWRR